MINQDKKTFNSNHPSPIVVSVCDGGCGVGSGEAAGTVTIPPPNDGLHREGGALHTRLLPPVPSVQPHNGRTDRHHQALV